MNMPIGYAWQQVVKLMWPKYSDAIGAFIIDSDEIFTREFDLSDKASRFWFYHPWANAGASVAWAEAARYCLKRNPEYDTMCVPGFYLSRKLTIDFLEFMHKEHKQPWEHFALTCPFQMSEFTILGNYLLGTTSSSIKDEYTLIFVKNYKQEYEKLPRLPIKLYWSHGGLTAEIITEIKNLIGT